MTEDSDRKTGEMRHWYRWFWAAALLFAGMVYFYYIFPHEEIGTKQPIYFSHRVHAGVKQINCRFCHPYVERSEHAGLPEVEKCFFCHKYIIPSHPQLVEEKKYLDSKTPVPWVQIFFVPDFVKFNHQPHIRWGKLDCSQCHGNVAAMDRLQRVDFQMGFCIACHKERNAQLDCWLACHH
jgi:hypothetical protein